MDKYVSYFAMPLGVLICFGPALVAWLIAERKSSNGQSSDDPARK